MNTDTGNIYPFEDKKEEIEKEVDKLSVGVEKGE